MIADTYIGGISADLYKYASISNCYNMGTIGNSNNSTSKTIYIGGITPTIALSTGESYKMENCYNAGKIVTSVLDESTVIYAGNIAAIHETGTIKNCYYEKNDFAGIGKHQSENCIDDITEVNCLDMKSHEIVDNLNTDGKTYYYYDDENINKGYPILEWQYIALLTIKSNVYEVKKDELYIIKIQPETILSDFKSNIETNAEVIEIYNKNNELVVADEVVSTGMKIKFILNSEQKEYTLVVLGDTNGDGKANFSDILQINKHRLNKVSLIQEYLKSGDVTGDGIADFSDILQINKYRLGKIDSL